jgi:hypothetical protein
MNIEHFMSGNMLRLLKKHNVQCAMCNVKRKSTTFVGYNENYYQHYAEYQQTI